MWGGNWRKIMENEENIHIFLTSKWIILCPYQSTMESRGSHLHPQNNTKIHFIPKKSKIHDKVKFASNVQCYNPMPLVLSANSYRIIVLGHTLNVNLIPYGNANDQKFFSITFPSLRHIPSGYGHAFRAVTHFPSSVGTPILGSPSLIEASSHWKIQKPRHILPQRVIPIIACS